MLPLTGIFSPRFQLLELSSLSLKIVDLAGREQESKPGPQVRLDRIDWAFKGLCGFWLKNGNPWALSSKPMDIYKQQVHFTSVLSWSDFPF